MHPYLVRQYSQLDEIRLDQVEGDIAHPEIDHLLLHHNPQRTKQVLSIEGGEFIGQGSEGIVFQVRIHLATAIGSKAIGLAEKTFKHPYETEFYRTYDKLSPLGNPELQWSRISEVRERNRSQHAGIRLPKTVLLRRFSNRRARILTSLLQLARPVGDADWTQFKEDRAHQQKLLGKLGFIAGDDSYFPIRDRITQKIVALLGDFGSLYEIKH